MCLHLHLKHTSRTYTLLPYFEVDFFGSRRGSYGTRLKWKLNICPLQLIICLEARPPETSLSTWEFSTVGKPYASVAAVSCACVRGLWPNEQLNRPPLTVFTGEDKSNSDQPLCRPRHESSPKIVRHGVSIAQ